MGADQRIEIGGAEVAARLQGPDRVRMHSDWGRQGYADSDLLPDQTGDGARPAWQPNTPGVPSTVRQRREVRGPGPHVLGRAWRSNGDVVGRRAQVQGALSRLRRARLQVRPPRRLRRHPSLKREE